MPYCESDRIWCAGRNDGVVLANDEWREKTGRPCAKDGVDKIDPIESERSGIPKWIDGKERRDVVDPMESDRRGAARRRFGNEMIDTPLVLEPFRVPAALLSSLEITA